MHFPTHSHMSDDIECDKKRYILHFPLLFNNFSLFSHRIIRAILYPCRGGGVKKAGETSRGVLKAKEVLSYLFDVYLYPP